MKGRLTFAEGPSLLFWDGQEQQAYSQTTESRAQDAWLCQLLLMAQLRPPKLVFGKEVCRDRQHLTRQALTQLRVLGGLWHHRVEA